MNATKVQYTVQTHFVETNKQNIARVMAAIRQLNRPDFKYSTFILDDGKTFVHIVFRADGTGNEVLANLPEFQQFQQALQASQPEQPPRAENMNLVAAGWDMFEPVKTG